VDLYREKLEKRIKTVATQIVNSVAETMPLYHRDLLELAKVGLDIELANKVADHNDKIERYVPGKPKQKNTPNCCHICDDSPTGKTRCFVCGNSVCITCSRIEHDKKHTKRLVRVCEYCLSDDPKRFGFDSSDAAEASAVVERIPKELNKPFTNTVVTGKFDENGRVRWNDETTIPNS
jgi:hypothetical protein